MSFVASRGVLIERFASDGVPGVLLCPFTVVEGVPGRTVVIDEVAEGD